MMMRTIGCQKGQRWLPWITLLISWPAQIAAEDQAENLFRCNLTGSVDAYLYLVQRQWHNASAECKESNRSLTVDRNIIEECVLNLPWSQTYYFLWSRKFNGTCHYIIYNNGTLQEKPGECASAAFLLFFICQEGQEDTTMPITHSNTTTFTQTEQPTDLITVSMSPGHDYSPKQEKDTGASKDELNGGIIVGITVGMFIVSGVVIILFVVIRRGKFSACIQTKDLDPSEPGLSPHAHYSYPCQTNGTDNLSNTSMKYQATNETLVYSVAGESGAVYETAKNTKGGEDKKNGQPESGYEYATTIVGSPTIIKPPTGNNEDLSNAATYDHINKPNILFLQENVYSHTEIQTETEYAQTHTSNKSSINAALNDDDTYNHLQGQVRDTM